MADIVRSAHAVLFPISDTFDTSGWFGEFLGNGGRSVLMASSAEEYGARRISDERRAREKADHVADFGARANAAAGAPVVLAADAEPAGVQRLEHLLPGIPGREALANCSDEELHDAFVAYARSAKSMGVSMFVGPVLDVITGRNDWLTDRTMSDSLDEVGRIGAIYAKAVRSEGITAMAKHFPGHPDLPANAIYENVVMSADRAVVDRNIEPFVRLIRAGVGSVMVGPSIITALDPDQPAATSPIVIGLLRSLGFEGVVVSDDLDAASTMRGRTLGDVAVASVAAGVQMLLTPGGADNIAECADALVEAVRRDDLDPEALSAAARAVDTFADSTADGS